MGTQSNDKAVVPAIFQEKVNQNQNQRSKFQHHTSADVWASFNGKSRRRRYFEINPAICLATRYLAMLVNWLLLHLTDKMKRSFFQAAVVSILLYGCTTWTLTKRLEKKLDRNYTRMLRAVLNKSWRQHPTRHQLYGHLPPITKTIQVRRTRHAGHCWRSKDELISDVLLWTPTYGQAKTGRPARTYIQQLCEDTGCNPEDLPKAINDREKWRERVRDIRAGGTTWWWWWHRLREWRKCRTSVCHSNLTTYWCLTTLSYAICIFITSKFSPQPRFF